MSMSTFFFTYNITGSVGRVQGAYTTPPTLLRDITYGHPFFSLKYEDFPPMKERACLCLNQKRPKKRHLKSEAS